MGKKDFVGQIFVDRSISHNDAKKKARRKLKIKIPNITSKIFSIQKQGYKKGRYVVWYKFRRK